MHQLMGSNIFTRMKRPWILIADDDHDDQFLLRTAFNDCGSEEDLEFVDNGVELLKFLNLRIVDNENDLPEFILLDLNMPLKNGKEALQELKQHPALKRIPVIIYTTTRNETEIKKCYELGANSYIVKPSSFDDLVGFVGTLRSYWLNVSIQVSSADSHAVR
jgi:CheY-like chemotaxis protein